MIENGGWAVGEILKMEKDVMARVVRELDATDLALLTADDLAMKDLLPISSKPNEVQTFSSFLTASRRERARRRRN